MRKEYLEKIPHLIGCGLVASLFLPLAGPLAAAGGFLAGSYSILSDKKEKNASQEQEPLLYEREDDYPTTAAARRKPYETASFLEYKAEEETYRASLISSSIVAKTFLDNLPKGALDNSKGLNIQISRKNDGLLSFLNSESEEINMRIRVK
ncbi:MAG: hypothetical protein QW273_01005 [Candidatus Pacearchaeota archaeon]